MILSPTSHDAVIPYLRSVILNEVKDLLSKRFFANAQNDGKVLRQSSCSRPHCVSAGGLPPRESWPAMTPMLERHTGFHGQDIGKA